MVLADIGDILEVVVFAAIIVVTLVVRALKAVAEKAQSGAGSKTNHNKRAAVHTTAAQPIQWWEIDSEPPPPKPPPKPPKKQQSQSASSSSSSGKTKTSSASTASLQSETFSETQSEVTPPAPWEDAWQSKEIGAYNYDKQPHRQAREEMEQAMAVAFPKARKMLKEIQSGSSRHINISVKGRRNLRRAVLFKEALGQPRAFDL